MLAATIIIMSIMSTVGLAAFVQRQSKVRRHRAFIRRLRSQVD
jgi:type II secretory pathway pseudopilin PulG